MGSPFLSLAMRRVISSQTHLSVYNTLREDAEIYNPLYISVYLLRAFMSHLELIHNNTCMIIHNNTCTHTGCEAPDSGTEQISVQLDPGLPDRQKSGGQNGQQHLISPDPQHWCSTGLRPQPTPVFSVHTRAGRYGPKNYHDNYFHISRYR